MYQPKPGDRIRVTRHRPDGEIQFIKTGKVERVSSYGYDFHDDEYGRRFLADSESIAKSPGWTQSIEPLSEPTPREVGLEDRRWDCRNDDTE